MVQIANISTTVQRLTDRSGKVVEIQPGETTSVDIDKESFRVTAKVRAQFITVGGTATSTSSKPKAITAKKSAAKKASTKASAPATGTPPAA